MFKRLLNFTTHKIYNLPVLVLMPHSSCNCRCVMCDIWKANHSKKEISVEVLQKHISSFANLKVREVVLSGGEALLHSNLWKFCEVLHGAGIKVTLLSTGLLLKKFSHEIADHINQVIVSLDGSEEIHNKIRNIPNAFGKMSEGIHELKTISPKMRITGRSVLQHLNYRDFINIVKAARQIQLDQISFLPADVSTNAFNRTNIGDGDQLGNIVLTIDETNEFEGIVQESFHVLQNEYKSRFIAENPAKMSRIVQYYRAINGTGDFPPVVCNAPWISAVIETDGSVMPCFFHKPMGNIYEKDFLQIVNSKEAISWRRRLDMSNDPVCKKCVCTLKLGLTQMN
jgi:Fe-coproporphyrin III synthase